MACYRMVESCDASAVSLGKSGPAREPHHLYAVHDWTRQGTEGFLGHRRCQGQTSGARARRQGALILMGGWCGAQGADITTRKTGGRLRLQIWGVPGGTQQAKSCQKWWKGEVLPLDRSLLMGGFSDDEFRQAFMYISGPYSALHQKSG